MTTNPGISPLYFEIGKELATTLALSYAAADPRAALTVTAIKTVLAAQAAVAAHDSILAKAQTEGWSDTDARWDAVLDAQQVRMDAVNLQIKAVQEMT